MPSPYPTSKEEAEAIEVIHVHPAQQNWERYLLHLLAIESGHLQLLVAADGDLRVKCCQGRPAFSSPLSNTKWRIRKVVNHWPSTARGRSRPHGDGIGAVPRGQVPSAVVAGVAVYAHQAVPVGVFESLPHLIRFFDMDVSLEGI